ncbi:uncharacterized protein LOC129404854 [Sorex araneus]|uniref:uncharacterized protein LOC129404854 n=1 Tax=Sorex araneus TaxID=42254 RepID=UPI002433BD12|nr:uncharacterized protein LOC129404854 [Sorex araneus]
MLRTRFSPTPASFQGAGAGPSPSGGDWREARGQAESPRRSRVRASPARRAGTWRATTRPGRRPGPGGHERLFSLTGNVLGCCCGVCVWGVLGRERVVPLSNLCRSRSVCNKGEGTWQRRLLLAGADPGLLAASPGPRNLLPPLHPPPRTPLTARQLPPSWSRTTPGCNPAPEAAAVLPGAWRTPVPRVPESAAVAGTAGTSTAPLHPPSPPPAPTPASWGLQRCGDFLLRLDLRAPRLAASQRIESARRAPLVSLDHPPSHPSPDGGSYWGRPPLAHSPCLLFPPPPRSPAQNQARAAVSGAFSPGPTRAPLGSGEPGRPPKQKAHPAQLRPFQKGGESRPREGTQGSPFGPRVPLGKPLQSPALAAGVSHSPPCPPPPPPVMELWGGERKREPLATPLPSGEAFPFSPRPQGPVNVSRVEWL